jgi:hypothetical protein
LSGTVADENGDGKCECEKEPLLCGICEMKRLLMEREIEENRGEKERERGEWRG